MPDTAPPRKRASRFWLILPYGAVIIAFLGWSAAWFVIRDQVAAAMDRTAAEAKAHGLTLTWADRTIDGYPFRIMITLTQPRMAEPSGWSLSAPRIKAIANAYDLNHWVAATAEGMTLTRPNAGATNITGQAIRASYVNEGADAPRVVVEGIGVAFTPAPGAKPFPLTRIAHAAFYTRTGPNDQMAGQLMLDDAHATPGSRFGDATGPAPIALMWQGIFTHVSAFHGPDAPTAARAWSAAGGAVAPVIGGLGAGPRSLGLYGTPLTLDADGRLNGRMSVVLRGGGDAIRALGADGTFETLPAIAAATLVDVASLNGGKATINATFEDGRTKLGPVPVAPAPKLF